MKAKNHLCTSNGAWTKLRRSELHGAVLVWTLCFVLKTIKIPPVLLFFFSGPAFIIGMSAVMCNHHCSVCCFFLIVFQTLNLQTWC